MRALRCYRGRSDTTTRSRASMHLVIMAWLFVIFTMALTMRSALAGIAMFVGLGLAPVALYMASALRRARRRRAQQRGTGER